MQSSQNKILKICFFQNVYLMMPQNSAKFGNINNNYDPFVSNIFFEALKARIDQLNISFESYI